MSNSKDYIVFFIKIRNCIHYLLFIIQNIFILKICRHCIFVFDYLEICFAAQFRHLIIRIERSYYNIVHMIKTIEISVWCELHRPSRLTIFDRMYFLIMKNSWL